MLFSSSITFGLGLVLLGCGGEPNPERSSSKLAAAPRVSRVLAVVERRASVLIELTTPVGVVTTTAEHPFAKVGAGLTRADQLVEGDRIATARLETMPIIHRRRIERAPVPVFNLVVEGSHTYYVGEAALLVHNWGCGLSLLPNAHRPGPSDTTAREPAPLTLRDWRDLDAYREGSKLRPPPGTAERRRLDDLEVRAALDPRDRARRWAREHPWPGEWPQHPEPGSLGTSPTQGELINLERYRDRTLLRPPPGTIERRRLDEIEAVVERLERSYPEGSPWKPPEDPRERAKRWVREHPWPAQWPDQPEPGALGSPPTLRELIELEAYRDGSKLRPPPGTLARRRLDEVEAVVELDESLHGSSRASSPRASSPRGGESSSDGGSSVELDPLEDPRERAKRWARDNPSPWQWPSPSEPGRLGSPPTLRELMDLEDYRDGKALRPPPGALARRRIDELEALVNRWEQSQSAGPPNLPEDPRERAKRWAREVAWPSLSATQEH